MRTEGISWNGHNGWTLTIQHKTAVEVKLLNDIKNVVKTKIRLETLKVIPRESLTLQ